MKQVVFAVFLIAMASLTGCLNGDDPSDSEDLIDPINAYEPPSSIRVDYGYRGYNDCNWTGTWVDYEYSDGNGTENSTFYDEEYVCEYIPCTKQGYQDLDGDGYNETYCDLDGHNNRGPQVVVNKIEKKVTIECIKSENLEYCRNYDYAYLIFTSIEGLQEMIYCDLAEQYYTGDAEGSQSRFHKCEATLGFEPASFEISHSTNYFGYKGSQDADSYYEYVVFRVF